jgi:peptide/nickel transport system ATP-binding protein
MVVMYAGKVAEMGTIRGMFTQPMHPYTQLLISSLPQLKSKGELQGIPGIAPSLLNPPTGCLFHPRCPKVMDICNKKTPVLQQHDSGQAVACHLY